MLPMAIAGPCASLVGDTREFCFSAAEKTEQRELERLSNEPPALSAVRLLDLFMEDALDGGLDVYICPVKMRLALPKKKTTPSVTQSNTNREEMMWLSAHLCATGMPVLKQVLCMIKPGGSLVSEPMFYSSPPSTPTASENYHQLTFEARYVTVLVEVEQSGDPRWRAGPATPHIHIHLYQQPQQMERWISRCGWKACGLVRPDAACGCCSRRCVCVCVVHTSCSENNR